MPISRNFGDDRHEVNRGRLDNSQLRNNQTSLNAAGTVVRDEAGGVVQRPESRTELIARIKRDQRPILPLGISRDRDQDMTNQLIDESMSDHDQSSVLHNTEEKKSPVSYSSTADLGQSIERPRSALHSGDFRQDSSLPTRNEDSFESDRHNVLRSTSPPAPWTTNHTRATVPVTPPRLHVPPVGRQIPTQERTRAASHSSLGSSYLYRFPTSPLAVQTNSVDIDTDEEYRRRSRSPDKNSRRRTFSPGALQKLRSEPSLDNTPSVLRREETFPQEHRQSQRSISSLHSFSSPHTPLSRSRRGSLLSDGSPLSGAPMVGGYEESILRGRMSTYPSKPLDFVAAIGVLGKGDCKPSLRCPPHISVPFPAVFYDYGSQKIGTRVAESGPSPYVGVIDLENREQPVEAGGMHVDPSSPPELNTRSSLRGITDSKMLDRPTTPSPERIKRKSRAKTSLSRSSPMGSYRIPQKGQLQVIIKNPNKTAVKLFLVPYDLDGMQPGQKTFIRQRSYSEGPIIDMAPSACKLLEGNKALMEDPHNRPILRYLIHMHICSPSKGRFYLYKSMRVVFANRVPDGKEKLRHETQLPQPRYSTYKPESNSALSIGNDVFSQRPRGFSFNSESLSRPSPTSTGMSHRRMASDTPMFQSRSSLSRTSGRQASAAQSNASDRMLLDDLDEALSPRSDWNTTAKARQRPPLILEEPLEFKRTPPVSPEKSSDGSPSPRDSLLAMQLRNLANEEMR